MHLHDYVSNLFCKPQKKKNVYINFSLKIEDSNSRVSIHILTLILKQYSNYPYQQRGNNWEFF